MSPDECAVEEGLVAALRAVRRVATSPSDLRSFRWQVLETSRSAAGRRAGARAGGAAGGAAEPLQDLETVLALCKRLSNAAGKLSVSEAKQLLRGMGASRRQQA